MTLVLKRSLGKPGTHALIIGAGIHEGDQVTYRQRAIEHASRDMVAWLTARYRNPSAEIATIDVYTYSWIWRDLDHVSDFVDQHTARAGHQQIETAAETWMKRASAHEDNIAIFYFAGRAFDQCQDTLLAFEDFEKPYWLPKTSKTGLVSLSGLTAAMRGCRARRQIYLLDIDRNEHRDQFQVEPLLRPGTELSPTPGQTIIYSAQKGQRSFHETDTEFSSRFVSLLTHFLETADPDPVTGAITTDRLATGLMERMNDRSAQSGIEQQIEFESTADFDFHYPSRPRMSSGRESGVGRSGPDGSAPPPSPAPLESVPEPPPPDDGCAAPTLPAARNRGIPAAAQDWIARHRDSLAVQVLGGLIVLLIAGIVAKVLGLTG